MEPYENQLIGAFLYAFGYAAAHRDVCNGNTGRAMPVNLLQQTPLDSAFGDLIVGSDRCLVIEFKRSVNELADERSKWSDDQMRTFVASREMLHLSLRSHLLVYGQRQESEMALRRCYYIDLLGVSQKCSLDRGCGIELIDIITRNFAAKDDRLGVSPADLTKYLKFLANVRKKKASKGGRTVADGAWVGVAEKNGRLVLQSANSLEMLLELDIERKYKKDLDREYERDHDLDRGFSL